MDSRIHLQRLAAYNLMMMINVYDWIGNNLDIKNSSYKCINNERIKQYMSTSINVNVGEDRGRVSRINW